MNESARPLCPTATATPMPATHWQIKEIQDTRGKSYQIIGMDGTVVASDVRSLEIARLFALSPFVFENFRPLLFEASRVLELMVDSSFYGIDEIAEDANGRWERDSPGAPAFASWLFELYELEKLVGPQAYPPEGVTWEYELFLD
ncbi:hypothetical protein QF021_002791 [Acidovorax delafieldii]|uniref:hypothetical protein n=1 Tax=Acidovorax delafieldii TaxID=47920 RepID=UPI0028541C67|nr:hypothetical protein [Acidovorax delafieldii]MDR6154702.1 hypothetical protein [Acidovorax delafieldii]